MLDELESAAHSHLPIMKIEYDGHKIVMLGAIVPGGSKKESPFGIVSEEGIIRAAALGVWPSVFGKVPVKCSQHQNCQTVPFAKNFR